MTTSHVVYVIEHAGPHVGSRPEPPHAATVLPLPGLAGGTTWTPLQAAVYRSAARLAGVRFFAAIGGRIWECVSEAEIAAGVKDTGWVLRRLT